MNAQPSRSGRNNAPDCPICNSAVHESWRKSEHQFFQCGRCEHLFYLPDQTDYVNTNYGDDYFDGAPGGYTDYLEKRRELIQQGKKYSRIVSSHHKTGRLLDIGSAAGFLLKGFVDEGWSGTGIEPNSRMADYARDEMNLNVINLAFEDYDSTDGFDAVSLVQVISHLKDPASCLARINGLLNEDGVLLIETWDRESRTARVFGKNWHQYNPPSVLHWYTLKELTALLQQKGFEVLARGRPTKWISVGNGAALVRHSFRETTIGRLAVSPLGLVPKALKVPYFLDDVFWMLARRTG